MELVATAGIGVLMVAFLVLVARYRKPSGR
jgi:hypothetical protein